MNNTPTIFPKIIEIQTASYCNAGCVICPHRDVARILPKGIMPMDLFRKIIDQIENPWGTRIIPYFNNEPFMDPHFIERLQYMKDKCPQAEIEISTNLSLLDEEMQEKISGIEVKELRMTIMGFHKETHSCVMPGLLWEKVFKNLQSIAKNKKLRKNIGQLSLVMIDYPDIEQADIELAKKFCFDNFIKFEFWGFLDRGGNVKAYTNNTNKKIVKGCEQQRPLERLHVTFTGDVVLCCMDWKWEHKMGNLNKQTIIDVWTSVRYQLYRNRIYSNTSTAPDLCKKCNLSL